jgi:hypothetical protein
VTLTGRGRQALEEAAPGHVDLVRRLFFGGLPEDLAGPLSEALESVYANIIRQGTLPPPADWHPAAGARKELRTFSGDNYVICHIDCCVTCHLSWRRCPARRGGDT